MEFTLTYRGPLKANRGCADKQAIRRHFHAQMQELWAQLPLKEFSDVIALPSVPGKLNLIHQVSGFHFAPLVSSRWHLIAELSITLLRPEPPGSLVGQGGDIDNRLKTLLDALRMPRVPSEVPAGDSPGPTEQPFFCLLEDDSLITKLAVATDRLFEPVQSKSEVLMLIHVLTKRTNVIHGNLALP